MFFFALGGKNASCLSVAFRRKKGSKTPHTSTVMQSIPRACWTSISFCWGWTFVRCTRYSTFHRLYKTSPCQAVPEFVGKSIPRAEPGETSKTEVCPSVCPPILAFNMGVIITFERVPHWSRSREALNTATMGWARKGGGLSIMDILTSPVCQRFLLCHLAKTV